MSVTGFFGRNDKFYRVGRILIEKVQNVGNIYPGIGIFTEDNLKKEEKLNQLG